MTSQGLKHENVSVSHEYIDIQNSRHLKIMIILVKCGNRIVHKFKLWRPQHTEFKYYLILVMQPKREIESKWLEQIAIVWLHFVAGQGNFRNMIVRLSRKKEKHYICKVD